MRNMNLRKQSDVVKIQTYNSMKNQLEQQNAALLRERANIQQQSRQQQGNTQSSYNSQQIQRQQVGSSPVQSRYSKVQGGQSSTTVNLIRSKVSQIINICQNQTGPQQFNQIAQAQRQILSYLDSIQSDNKKITSNTDSRYQQVSKKKKSRLNKTQVYQNNQNSYMNYFSDQAMQMIQEIQRKALVQIQALRIDKINLMKRLNQEIKAHNQEKKLRNGLENKLRVISEQARRSQQGKYMEVVAEENQDSYYGDNPEQVASLPQQSRTKAQKPHTRKKSNFLPENEPQQSEFQPHSQTQIQPQPPTVTRPKSQAQPQYQAQPQSRPQSQPQFYPDQNHPAHQYQPEIYPSQDFAETGQFQGPSLINSLNYQRTPVQPPRNTDNQIQRQIQRLNRQNIQIKQALNAPYQSPNIKLQLKTQLGQLEGKIRFFERQLSQRQRSTPNAGVSQLQNLILQANTITEDGGRLLKNNSKNSDNRPSSNSYEPEESLRYRTSLNDLQNTKKLQYRATIDYTRPPLQTFSPMDKSYHSQTYKGGFSPSKYENLIEQMNRVTRNR